PNTRNYSPAGATRANSSQLAGARADDHRGDVVDADHAVEEFPVRQVREQHDLVADYGYDAGELRASGQHQAHALADQPIEHRLHRIRALDFDLGVLRTGRGQWKADGHEQGERGERP